MRLQNLFSLATFSIGSLGLAALIADRALATRDVMVGRVESRGQAVAESIATLALPHLKDQSPLNRRALKLFAKLPSVDYVMVFDADGQPVFQAAPELARFRAEEPSDRLPIFQEIRDDGRLFGSIRLGLSLRSVHAELRRLMARGVALAVAALLAMALLSWHLGRLLGRQLEAFAAALEGFDEGGPRETPRLLRRSELTRVWGAFRNLHARLEEEKKRREATEKLKNDLASMIVHDLKHPLTVLRTVLFMIREPSFIGSPKTKEDEPLRMADRAVMRLNAMIEEVLQISRLTSSEVPLSKQRIQVGRFLEECGKENRLIAEHTGRAFRLALPPDAANLWILADQPLLGRLVGNLILNAVEHSPAGATVTLGALKSAAPGKVELFVHNEGPAIAEDKVAAIFEKFVTTGDAVRNVGLGLAFCKLAASRHDGTIAVQSREGEGTVFSVALPAGAP